MEHYRMPVLGHLAEPRTSAFRHLQCAACGSSVRVQLADLKLRVLEPFASFSTTMGGDWIATDEVAQALRHTEPSVSLRPVSIQGAEGVWWQVVPTKCVELAPTSLRSPREECATCGGVARVQFGDYPPLVIQGDEQSLPHVATICGAPLIIIFSEAVMRVLREAVPGFAARRVLLEKEALAPRPVQDDPLAGLDD